MNIVEYPVLPHHQEYIQILRFIIPVETVTVNPKPIYCVPYKSDLSLVHVLKHVSTILY